MAHVAKTSLLKNWGQMLKNGNFPIYFSCALTFRKVEKCEKIIYPLKNLSSTKIGKGMEKQKILSSDDITVPLPLALKKINCIKSAIPSHKLKFCLSEGFWVTIISKLAYKIIMQYHFYSNCVLSHSFVQYCFFKKIFFVLRCYSKPHTGIC